MSRIRDNYENSRCLKIKKWIDGEVDLLASGVEADSVLPGIIR